VERELRLADRLKHEHQQVLDEWQARYRIPDAQFFRVKRANLTRMTRCGQHGAHGAIP